MSVNRDSMVITPRITPKREAGPQRRAREARKTEFAKKKRAGILSKLQKAKTVRRMQAARAASRSKALTKTAGGLSKAARGLGAKAGSRLLGPVGIALLVMDAVNIAGSTVRRAEGGISGRLLEAIDQDTIYGKLDEEATAAANTKGIIEGDEDLLRIIGAEGRVNSQIGRLGTWFREREKARAIGADLIEREPAFDHLESIADKTIAKGASVIKEAADGFIAAVRNFFGGSPEPSGR